MFNYEVINAFHESFTLPKTYSYTHRKLIGTWYYSKVVPIGCYTNIKPTLVYCIGHCTTIVPDHLHPFFTFHAYLPKLSACRFAILAYTSTIDKS